MRRHGGRAPCLGQIILEVGHAFVRRAVQHVENGKCRDTPVVIAAPDGRIEKIVAGFFKSHKRSKLMAAALDVGMAGFPVVRCGSKLLQYRVCQKQAG